MRARTGAMAAALAILAAIAIPARAAGMADAPAASPPAVAEINYLLTAIGASGCEFMRNGTWHDAHQAQAHLREKYHWLSGRDRIRSAEDFIEVAATRSSMSGKAYAVRCGGQAPVSSNSWLTGQLRRYRETADAPRP